MSIESSPPGRHPPRPPLALNLGITGHRHFDPAITPTLTAAIAAVLAQVKADVAGLAVQHRDCFVAGPPCLTLLSGLAAGADQIAATAALAQGYRLAAVLPFDPATYAATMTTAEQASMASLLDQADQVWTVPPDAATGDDAYVLAADVTVAGCELLIAVWDGEPERGPGGTAAVVAEAIRRGVPVVHVPSDGQPPELLWAGLDAVPPERLRSDDVPRRAFDATTLAAVLARQLMPPHPAPELAEYLAETEQLRRWRPEWPLLLAATGVQKLRRASLIATPYAEANRDDWQAHAKGCAAAGVPVAGQAGLEQAFAWADGLATHYAHVFRSGMVFNFFGAALAVIMALLAALLPQFKIPLLIVELLLVGGVVINTAVGTRQQWHRRWLDYRYLAESLRPMRSLRLFVATNPPGRNSTAPRSWTSWYALAFWQSLPAPPSLPNAALRDLCRHVAAHELDAQIAYHHALSHRMHRLEHRLHRFGLVLLVLTVLVGLGTLTGLLLAYDSIKPASLPLSLLAAALPTAGAALFGLRAAGDFAGAARRSHATADHLTAVAAKLRRDDLSHALAARALEQAAAIMLDDLSQWRASYVDRKLAVPA